MNVLIISTYDIGGGAAIAAFRLMNALRKEGVNAKMLVRQKVSDDENIVQLKGKWRGRWNFLWERLVIFACNGFSRKKMFDYSIANTGFSVVSHPEFKKADVVHLHWINQGMLSLKEIGRILKSGKKVVWTLHDMWAFTGIEHICASPDEYQLLTDDKPTLLKFLSKWVFKQKQKTYALGNIRFVSVSRWLKSLAEASPLISKECEVIPNLIDAEIFKPRFGEEHPLLKNLQSRKVLVMGAARLDAPVKGFELLIDALDKLLRFENVSSHELVIVLFGNVKFPADFFPKFPIEYIHLGEITNAQEIAKIYSRADVTVVPSHFETFGQTISESMACGCPAVSFDSGGQTDIIDHLENGYLAKSGDTADFAKGIYWALFEAEKKSVREKSVEKVCRYFSSEVVAKQYIELYSQ